MHDADEQAICAYLLSWRGQYVSGAEICRKASTKHRFTSDSTWAYPVLERLVEQRLIESDTTGHYRMAPRVSPIKRPLRPMSPRIRKILERSGKEFSGVFEIDENLDKPPGSGG